VGEGGAGVRGLLIEERKKTERFAPGVPITEVIVGDLKGEVKLRQTSEAYEENAKEN